MSFNFDNFMQAMSHMLPVVGQAVTMLHPENGKEALKIQLGVAMVQALADALHQASVPAAEVPKEPPPPTLS